MTALVLTEVAHRGSPWRRRPQRCAAHPGLDAGSRPQLGACRFTSGRSRSRIVPTDERIAKLVGAILHDTARGSELLAARTSSPCARGSTARLITAGDNIVGLATAIRGVRVDTRYP